MAETWVDRALTKTYCCDIRRNSSYNCKKSVKAAQRREEGSTVFGISQQSCLEFEQICGSHVRRFSELRLLDLS